MIKASVVLTGLLMTSAASAKLSYSKSGHGPGVVLLHSLGGARSQWQREVARLEKSHTVVAIDLPGHGQTPPPAMVDFDAIAREVAGVIRAEKLAPAIVVGHSLGGTIAGHVPVVDVGAARAVVIVYSILSALPAPAAERDKLRASVARDHDGAIRKFYADLARADQLDRIMATAHVVPGKTWLAYLDAFATQSVPDGGRALKVPVLLMASKLLIDKPETQPKALVDGGFAHVADLTVARFDTLHWIAWEEPEKFDAVLDAFLARVEKR